jgi:hypothetical protein
MTLAERFNLVPPCLRNDDGGATVVFQDCVLGSISYYIQILFVIVGIAAFFYIVWAGIQMATAFGNEGKYTSAKNTLLHAIIGVIVATLAFTIVSFVTSFFGVDAPKIYNQDGSGGVIVNDENKVVTKVSFKPGADPGNGTLTPEEIQDAKDGTMNTSVKALGTTGAIYLFEHSSFRAVLNRKVGGPLNLNVDQLPEGGYWARAWGATTDFKGLTIDIYQVDPKTNFEHKKTVTIE